MWAGQANTEKVLFTDQRGKHVAHNPGTLSIHDEEGNVVGKQ